MKTMTNATTHFLFLLALCLAPTLRAATSEIKVNLRLDGSDFVSGERIRGVVDIANPSPERVSVGYPGSKDRVFVEVFRASDMHQLSRISRHRSLPSRLRSPTPVKME